MATAYGIYFTVMVAILFIGFAVWPSTKRVARGAGFKAAAGYRTAKVTSVVILSIAIVGFLFWPIAWYAHFQFVRFNKFTGATLLFAGFIPQIALLMLGLMYRPHRPYTRGRWSKHPPDVA